MRKRLLIPALVLVSVFALGASAPPQDEAPSTLEGLIVFHGPWAGGMDIFIDFNVRQVDPDTYRASGPVRWKIWHKEMGWRAVDAYASCVRFGEDAAGNPTAILVSRIVRKRGWGVGKFGEYAYWLLTDAPDGDRHSINYYRLDDPSTPEDEWYEFFPRGLPGPRCEPFDLTEDPVVVGMGDLAIR
jgi:hypothetical protein